MPKVQKTGAGAALLADPDPGGRRRAGRREGGDGLPVTVKLRSGRRTGETSGFELAHRLVAEAGVAAIGFHPRSAAVHHKGVPDYELAARLVESLDAPVILTGGLNEPEQIREAFDRTGAAAVMLARGALGNPWLFEQLLGPPRSERRIAMACAARGRAGKRCSTELNWTIDRAVEHLGEPRATRYLRKFYPWYVQRLEIGPADGEGVCRRRSAGRGDALQRLEPELAILLRSLSLPDGETPRCNAGFCCR